MFAEHCVNLEIDAVPDPAFHFHEVPDPDFHFDAVPGPAFHLKQIRIQPFTLTRIRIRNIGTPLRFVSPLCSMLCSFTEPTRPAL
jgi:hypothetical protein